MPVCPEAVSASSPHEVRRAVLTQSWTQLTFLHWPYDPAVVRPFLPAGVRPDVMEGSTWVGLIPFAMRRVRVAGLPELPYVSNFLETNVRLYGVDERGRRGVVFLSLEANRLLAVGAARVGYRLPYMWSSMTLHQRDDVLTYTARRRLGSARSLIRVRVGAEVTADPLGHFLTARWALHSRWYGGTAFAPITHEAWPLRRAELLELDDGLIPATGLPAPAGAPHVLYCAGVTARIGRPSRLGRA
jgi:uncharacterized protein YqjF (DUF2071 family)